MSRIASVFWTRRWRLRVASWLMEMDLDFGFTLLWGMCSIGCVVPAMISSATFRKDWMDSRFLIGVRLCSSWCEDDGRCPAFWTEQVCPWRLKDVVPMNVVLNQGSRMRIWFPRTDWARANTFLLDQPNTWESISSQSNCILLLAERKQLDGDYLGLSLLKKTSLSVWISGNLLVLCIFHWSAKKISDLH